jgi:hypothetical protein
MPASDKVPLILAVLAPAAVVLIALLLIFVSVPEGQGRDILMMLLGALVAMAKDVYGFEFGSSRGSREKGQAQLDGSLHGNGRG